MKLVRYRDEQGEKYGALISYRVVYLPSLAKRLNEKFPKRLEEFITSGTKGFENAEKLIENAKENDIRHASSLVNEITSLAPIAFPPKIICLGLNYRDHATEQNAPIPHEPIIFIKPHTTIIGPNEKLLNRALSNSSTMKPN